MIYTTDKLGQVSFNGTPMEVDKNLTTKTITTNGTYNAQSVDSVDGYSEVTVNVPSATLTTKTITANGTYNASSDSADGYSSVTVNVSGGGGGGGTTYTVTYQLNNFTSVNQLSQVTGGAEYGTMLSPTVDPMDASISWNVLMGGVPIKHTSSLYHIEGDPSDDGSVVLWIPEVTGDIVITAGAEIWEE